MDQPCDSLRVDVLQLLHQPGSRREANLRLRWEAESGASHIVPGSVVTVDLVFEDASEGIVLSGTVRADVELECARCLAPHKLTVTTEPMLLVERLETEDSDYVLAGRVLDLEPIVQDKIALAVPEYPTCGRSVADCDLPADVTLLLADDPARADGAEPSWQPDPRFARLSELLAQRQDD